MSESSENTLITTFATTVGMATDLVSGIPAPVKRNFFKALNQLCTAAIDWPAAFFEGKAAEKRAETESRVNLIHRSKEQLAAQLQVPEEYVRSAGQKFAARVIREQINLDAISAEATKQIVDATGKSPSADKQKEVPPISDDWLNQFEAQARQISSDEMRTLFAKVLATEIQQPSSFSIRTVKLLGELDTQAATVFRRLCSLTISLRVLGRTIDARVCSLGGTAGGNALQDYGLSFDQLNLLQEHDLIISDYNSYMDYRAAVCSDGRTVQLGYYYRGQLLGLASSGDKSWDEPFKIHGVALSHTGKQLSEIVEIETDSDIISKYTDALRNYFESKQLSVIPVQTSPSPAANATQERKDGATGTTNSG